MALKQWRVSSEIAPGPTTSDQHRIVHSSRTEARLMPQQMRPLSGAAETTANVTIGFDQGYAPANWSRSAGPNEPDRMRCTECNFKGIACPNSQSGPIWHNYAPYINKAVDMAHKFDKQCCMKTNRPRLPDAQECALLFLRLLEIRKEEAPGASRARV
jgi:hypothetical protein